MLQLVMVLPQPFILIIQVEQLVLLHQLYMVFFFVYLGTKLTQASTSIHGNKELIYSHVSNQILFVNAPTGGTAWSNYGTTITAGNTVASYNLR